MSETAEAFKALSVKHVYLVAVDGKSGGLIVDENAHSSIAGAVHLGGLLGRAGKSELGVELERGDGVVNIEGQQWLALRSRIENKRPSGDRPALNIIGNFTKENPSFLRDIEPFVRRFEISFDLT